MTPSNYLTVVMVLAVLTHIIVSGMFTHLGNVHHFVDAGWLFSSPDSSLQYLVLGLLIAALTGALVFSILTELVNNYPSLGPDIRFLTMSISTAVFSFGIACVVVQSSIELSYWEMQ